MTVTQMIKTMVQNSLYLFGVQLHKITTSEQRKQLAEAEQKKRLQWLIDMQIKTIFDIGANTGQFAQTIYNLLPDAMIYSFEPLPDCYEELVASFAGKQRFKSFNLALGNETGKIKMNRNEYSPSSSLLPMAELHKKAYPFAQKEVVQEVSIARLDDVVSNFELRKPILIKLDVQGFEDKVIAGGMNIIEQADILLIELSMEQLYENQPIFEDIYQILVKLGFKYRGNYDQLYSPLNGKILQIDGIFIK